MATPTVTTTAQRAANALWGDVEWARSHLRPHAGRTVYVETPDCNLVPLDTRDGVKVTLPEGWFLVRGSNTEPIIRVVAESRSESQAREIVTRIYDRVASCIK